MAEVSNEVWEGEWCETTAARHYWLRNNVEADGPEKRWFVPQGSRLWPLLAISVWPRYPTTPIGVQISVAYKAHANAWFEDCNLPEQLRLTLIDMLSRVR